MTVRRAPSRVRMHTKWIFSEDIRIGHYYILSQYIGHTRLIDVSAVRSMPYLISLIAFQYNLIIWRESKEAISVFGWGVLSSSQQMQPSCSANSLACRLGTKRNSPGICFVKLQCRRSVLQYLYPISRVVTFGSESQNNLWYWVCSWLSWSQYRSLDLDL